MKNIFKISSIIAVMFFAATSCTKNEDDNTIVNSITKPELLTPDTGTVIVLDPANMDNLATALVWNDATYDVNTVINYTVEIAAAGTDFAAPYAAATTTDRFFNWTVDDMNSDLLAFGAVPYEEIDIDVRIKSSLGDVNMVVQYSDPITLTVTPYTTEAPKLYVVGGFQAASGYGSDWTPADAVPIAASGFGQMDFEGYVFMNVAAPEFKILPTNIDFSGDYGDDGSFSGTLLQDGESNILLSAPGYYWIKADTDAMTYSATPTAWGIIGSATPTAWDSDTNMTYDQTTKKWTIVIDLIVGEIKFRANDAWDINYGDAGTDGVLDFNDSTNIPVTAAGNYTVTLDLSNPRNYTYSLSLN